MAKTNLDLGVAFERSQLRREPTRETRYTRPDLKVLEHERRIDAIRSRLVPFLVGSVILIALFVAVLARAEMAPMQLKLQNVQGEIAKASNEQQSLLVSVGQLSSPSRVLHYAEKNLGLVPPTQSRLVGGASLSSGQSVTKIPVAQQQVPLPAGYQVAPPNSGGKKVG